MSIITIEANGSMKKSILFFGATLILTLLSSCSASKSSNPSAPADLTGSIAGGAWIDRASGQSDLLRGLNVSLCKSSEAAQFQRPKTSVEFSSSHQFTMLTMGLDLMDKRTESKSLCLDRVATDINAKYQFPNVPSGSYLLYASFRSPNALAYWSIPVTVGNQPIQQDINTENAADILNR